MNKSLLITVLWVLLFTSCKTKHHEESSRNTTMPAETSSKMAVDTTPKITGIGGIFFLSEDATATVDWYRENLGLVTDVYGAVFETRNAIHPTEPNYARLSVFDESSDYFQPSSSDFMINYRVHNLEGLLRKLRKNNVTILEEIEVYDYGKFVHILDPEGRKIELWEPVDSVLTALGSPTNK